MELQLGLSLSITNNQIHGLDMNNHFPFDPNGIDTGNHGGCLENNDQKKRRFHEAFEGTRAVTRNLPLLLWDNHPNDDDEEDDSEDRGKRSQYSTYTIIKDDGEGNSVVGWPPVQSWRKKLHHQHRDGQGFVESNFMYVKVKMEGVAIGRKVDLSLHHSYQTLADTLICMFQKYQKGSHGSNEVTSYALTYQDREGDWLLAGDVPWQTFIESVQCLKIIRSCR